MSFYDQDNGKVKVAGIDVPYDLDVNGFEAGQHGARDVNFREDRIAAAREIIRTSLKKLRGDDPRTRSNWVQCKVEEKLGTFLYPGELIVAMIGEGFAYKRIGRECFFNVNTGTLNNLGTRQPYYAHRRR